MFTPYFFFCFYSTWKFSERVCIISHFRYILENKKKLIEAKKHRMNVLAVLSYYTKLVEVIIKV